MGADMLAVSGLVAGVDRRAIARLDALEVAAGEAALLAGPSGMGKTTLVLAIAGLAEVLAGSIRADGEELTSLAPRARDRHRGRHIGIVFQDLHLVSGLSAIDNMLLAPFAIGGQPDRAHALALLERLGVAGRAQARAETLSRGEAQRVAIARAIMLQPRLLLADEPTASLDDDACSAVLDLLLEATRDSGAALIIATHDGRLRRRIDRVASVQTA